MCSYYMTDSLACIPPVFFPLSLFCSSCLPSLCFRWRWLRSGWQGHGGVDSHGAVAVWTDWGWPDLAEGEDRYWRKDSGLPHPPARGRAGLPGSQVKFREKVLVRENKFSIFDHVFSTWVLCGFMLMWRIDGNLLHQSIVKQNNTQ